MSATIRDERPTEFRPLWIAVGAVLAIGLQFLPPPAGVTPAGWATVSLFAVMLIWWVTEAVPIPVTSLLPLVILPIAGVMPIAEAAVPYASPIVLLLLGGFIIAKSVERWNLHSRIALAVVARAGSRPAAMVAGFMAAAALLSMWISNTATAIMLMSIALSVADRLEESGAFRIALLLAVAYGCSIGGIGTPIGTPTNLIIIGYLENEFGRSIGFVDWMIFGLPMVLLLIPLAWLTLTQLALKLPRRSVGGAREVIASARAALGPVSTPERRVATGFAVVAAAWLLRKPLEAVEFGGVTPFAGLTDHVIAVAGAVFFFLIPSGAKEGGALLAWRDAERIPWGVLLLFGGGLSLAAAISSTGLSGYLGAQIAAATTLPTLLLIAVFVAFIIFATEVMSNVAAASALMPVIGAAAVAGGLDPMLLALPVAAAASCAFMLPMATGPNAIAYASGAIRIPQMARIGLLLNVLAIIVISLAATLFFRVLPLS